MKIQVFVFLSNKNVSSFLSADCASAGESLPGRGLRRSPLSTQTAGEAEAKARSQIVVD